MIHTNSLQAHQLNISFNSYSNMSERIVAKLKELGEATMQQISDALQVPLNKISGRFGELVKRGKIFIVRTIKQGKYSYSVYKAK